MGLFLMVNVAGKEVLGSSHGCLSKRLVLLGGRSSGPWEFKLAHRTSPSFQHKHDDEIETNASTVRRVAPLETVGVVGHCLEVDLDLILFSRKTAS